MPWAAPGDWDIARLADQFAFIPTGDGFHIAFADGTVWQARGDVPYETLRKFFLIDKARELDRDPGAPPYRLN